MGVAGINFEPHPPNSQNLYNFLSCSSDVKTFFDISTGFRYKKNREEFSVHVQRKRKLKFVKKKKKKRILQGNLKKVDHLAILKALLLFCVLCQLSLAHESADIMRNLRVSFIATTTLHCSSIINGSVKTRFNKKMITNYRGSPLYAAFGT